MNNYKKLAVIIFISVLICLAFLYTEKTKRDFEYKIENYFIDKCNTSDECVINFKTEFNNFIWDKFYFLQYGSLVNDISSLKQFDRIEHGLSDRHIIFTLDNKIIFEQRLKTSVESIDGKSVWVVDLDSKEKYIVVNIDNSKFKIEKVLLGNTGYFGKNYYFKLTPIKNESKK